jgi:hypothetical protein
VDYEEDTEIGSTALTGMQSRPRQRRGNPAFSFASSGAVVPGKAKHPGNDPRNDTKTYKLSPGEIVIPRSASDTPEHAMEFLKAIKKWKGSKDGDGHGFSKVASAQKSLQEIKKQLAALEKQLGRAS